jgi:hypothetical protein
VLVQRQQEQQQVPLLLRGQGLWPAMHHRAGWAPAPPSARRQPPGRQAVLHRALRRQRHCSHMLLGRSAHGLRVLWGLRQLQKLRPGKQALPRLRLLRHRSLPRPAPGYRQQ